MAGHSSGRVNVSERTQQLLAEFRETAEQGIVPIQIYNDPEIFQLELDRIFSRCWIFIGHESELPKPGDYVTRKIANDPYILIRDEHGEIRCLLNACRHRGVPLCRAEKGNTSHFRCPYHNWIYKNTGEWIGAPEKARAYRKLDSSEWGLLSVPRLATYRGLIFASLAEEGPSLEEYLGDMRFYLDGIFGLHESGMVVIGEPQRWRVKADWKSAAENNTAGDNYHAPQLHRFDVEVGIQAFLKGQGVAVRLFVTEAGHSGICSPPFVENTIWGYPHELTDWFQLDRLSEQVRDWVVNFPAIIVGVFPNFAVLRTAERVDPNSDSIPPYPFTRIEVFNPVGPGEMEVWNWYLEWKDVSDYHKMLSYRGGILAHGIAGTYEQDDAVVWEGTPVAAASMLARKKNMKFNFQLGIPGMSDTGFLSEEEWPYPGRAVWGGLNDITLRNFHLKWLEYMVDEK